jgi:predicted  nucleic acid-binding Zn-ribbon protein
MSRTAKQIKIELDQITKRLDELIEMQTGINTNLKTLQDGFIGGKKSLDEVQTEQSKLTILNDSIKSLEARQRELQTAFDNQSAAEARQDLLEKLAETGKQAEPLFNEYLEVRAELHEHISRYAETLLEKISAYRNKQREYRTLLSQIEPQINKATRIDSTVYTGFYASIATELKAMGLTDNDLKFATQDAYSAPDLPFGQPIFVAQQILFNKLEKEKSIREKVELDKQRAERNAAQQAAVQAEKEAEQRRIEAEQQRVVQYQRING